MVTPHRSSALVFLLVTVLVQSLFIISCSTNSSVLKGAEPQAVQYEPSKETVSIQSRDAYCEEGQVMDVTIVRTTLHGDLPVLFSIHGDAQLNEDYSLPGVKIRDSGILEVTLPNGHNTRTISLEVIDDVHAEADETIILTLLPNENLLVDQKASSITASIPQNDYVVTSTDDAGEGTLRQAIVNANKIKGPATIRFDPEKGPFKPPQTIFLRQPLPTITDEFTIDGYIPDRLWKPTGVTVMTGGPHRIFNISRGANVTLKHLTVAKGRSAYGGGILNHGDLVVDSMTFIGNSADRMGGGLINLGGNVKVINCTFVDNQAGYAGGALADNKGITRITNCTFSGNASEKGGGIFSRGALLLSNTIVANSAGESDCTAEGKFDPKSTNNLIMTNQGCGKPISGANPQLASMGSYNGPTHTIPLGAGSPAINLGDNDSAIDAFGNPLIWDQRGNGDPRFVGGYTDIGAFETQKFPTLVVDTIEDTELRACTKAGEKDCSLRGAIMLANASDQLNTILFDEKLFSSVQTISLRRPLPSIDEDLTINASDTAGVKVHLRGKFNVFKTSESAKLTLTKVNKGYKQ